MDYDKAAIKLSGREAVTNFELGSYEHEMTYKASNEDDHNLDLSLGISLPSGNCKKQNERCLKLSCGVYNMQGETSSRVKIAYQMENPLASNLGKLPLRRPLWASNHIPYGMVYPQVYYGPRKKEKRRELNHVFLLKVYRSRHDKQTQPH